jgi:cysteinyl-tRNA synthetase
MRRAMPADRPDFSSFAKKMWLPRGRFAMVTGNSAAVGVRQPQGVAVRLPHPLRMVEIAIYSGRAHLGDDRPSAADAARAQTAGPLRDVSFGRAAAVHDPMTPRAYLIFALKVAASAVVGAVLTIGLWSAVERPSTTAMDPSQLGQAAERPEVYRVARAPARHDRPLRSWDAQTTFYGQPVASELIRDLKMVKFIAPAAQEIAAALPPVTQGNRSPVAVPIDKPPEIRSWRYQLQGINPYVVANSPADLVVIDLFRDEGTFTKPQVEQMRRKPDGSRRIVLSYMSIGEAEDYRWYWPHRSSAWLGPENPKWRGNFGVRFWHADWQKIIFEYTDKIVAAGFDGIYLDKVDEFEEMGHQDDMVEFVARIAARAKSQRSDFMIVSQNGDALIPNAKFRRAIDAFAREDLLYGESSDGARNSPGSIRESVRRLKMLTAEGKPVLVVEYPRNEEQAKTARREIAEHNFIGLMARRDLDQLER